MYRSLVLLALARREVFRRRMAGRVTPTGVSATGAAAALAPPVNVTVSLLGLSCTGSAGTIAQTHSGASIAITGVSGSAAIGSLSAVAAGAIASVTGVSATGTTGSLSFTQTASLILSGVAAAASVGSLVGTSSTRTVIVPASRTVRVRAQSRIVRV